MLVFCKGDFFLSRRDRGILGGIFVKTPPKTSKNVSFGNAGFVGKESAGSFG